jgi:hypothetical protein
VCSSIDMTARTLSIVTKMKEEQQIKFRIEFGVERGRTRVEGERIRVGEVLVYFNWVSCPQSAMAPCI